MSEEKLGIYIHIPFCVRKCKYCDFVSFEKSDEIIWEEYVDKLIKEIDIVFQNESKKFKEIDYSFINSKKVDTIYFGGGTPSYINEKLIGKILDKIKDKFNVLSDAEITLEVNPGTGNKEKLEYYKKIGINRLSIGLQTTEKRLLELIGRIHTYEEFLEVYNLARECGFKNINVDLMLGLPTQTMDELVLSLINVVNLNPEHISLYSLILEEGTPLEREVAKGKYDMLSENVERKMYWKTKRFLEKNKYFQYEISNFSKKGYESKHNFNCWNQEEYLGFGLAAHSYINNIRYSNKDSLEEYLKCDIDELYEIQEKQSIEDKIKEYMILKLRTIQGVCISDFEQKFGINPLMAFRFELEKLVVDGLIDIDLNNIYLTKKGLDFANFVFEEFI